MQLKRIQIYITYTLRSHQVTEKKIVCSAFIWQIEMVAFSSANQRAVLPCTSFGGFSLEKSEIGQLLSQRPVLTEVQNSNTDQRNILLILSLFSQD